MSAVKNLALDEWENSLALEEFSGLEEDTKLFNIENYQELSVFASTALIEFGETLFL